MRPDAINNGLGLNDEQSFPPVEKLSQRDHCQTDGAWRWPRLGLAFLEQRELLGQKEVFRDQSAPRGKEKADEREQDRILPIRSYVVPPNLVRRISAISLRNCGQSTVAAFQTSFQSIPKYAWIRMLRKAMICGHGIRTCRLFNSSEVRAAASPMIPSFCTTALRISSDFWKSSKPICPKERCDVVGSLNDVVEIQVVTPHRRVARQRG